MTRSNESCLQLAARVGHVQICKRLLLRKAEVNFTDCKGATPLYIACQEGHHQVRLSVLWVVGCFFGFHAPLPTTKWATPPISWFDGFECIIYLPHLCLLLQVVELLLQAKASTAMGNGEMAFDCGCVSSGRHCPREGDASQATGTALTRVKNTNMATSIFIEAQKFGQKEVHTGRYSHCWPLFAAIRGHHDRVVRLLLNRKLRPLVDVNHVDAFGAIALAVAKSPLHAVPSPPDPVQERARLRNIVDIDERVLAEEEAASVEEARQSKERKRARIISLLEAQEATTVGEILRQRERARLDAEMRRLARSKWAPAERYEKALAILRRVFNGFFARREFAQKKFVLTCTVPFALFGDYYVC